MTTIDMSNSNPERSSDLRAISLKQLNVLNREFWDGQSSLSDARLADTLIFQTAIEDLESEAFRKVALYSRKSLEQALEDAAGKKERFDKQSRVEHARQGGKAPKPDALQQFVLACVKNRPSLTQSELLVLVESDHDFDIEDNQIFFAKSNGAEKSVLISALKDRLLRAKKKINSR